MRCKAGDLAVIVNSDFEENIGALVEVIELHSTQSWRVVLISRGKGWDTRGQKLLDLGPGATAHVRDDNLRPLRGGKGEDETLTWKPHEVAS